MERVGNIEIEGRKVEDTNGDKKYIKVQLTIELETSILNEKTFTNQLP